VQILELDPARRRISLKMLESEPHEK
jgi:ribosomal protein S1